MKVSVVIPSYQGAEKIPFLLKALEEQTFRDFELVVVIDGSRDNTETVVKSHPLLKPKIVNQKNQGRSGARNSGVRASSGDIIIFYDDDAVPDRKSIEQHVAFHAKHPGGIITGYTPQWLNQHASDFERYRAYLSERWTSHFPDKLFRFGRENLFITTHNCSVSRRVFEQLHGFDEHLSDNEDKDFASRAFAIGVPLYFDKGNVAWHKETITCQSYIARLRSYAAVHNRLHEGLHNVTAAESNTINKYIYSLVARRWIVRLIDSFNIFCVLPKSVRYRFYDALTHSLSVLHPNVKL